VADPSQRIESGALALGAIAGVLVMRPPGSESYVLRFAVSGLCIAMGAGLLLRKRGVLHKYMKLIDPVLAARDPDGRSGQWTALGVFALVCGLAMLVVGAISTWGAPP